MLIVHMIQMTFLNLLIYAPTNNLILSKLLRDVGSKFSLTNSSSNSMAIFIACLLSDIDFLIVFFIACKYFESLILSQISFLVSNHNFSLSISFFS